MRFYLGAHRPGWLADVAADVALFVSRTTFPKTKLPRAAGPWALDSGGFTELSRNGAWRITEREYVAEVKRFRDEVGHLEWAAPMDWMCEPAILRGDRRLGWPGTGLTVEEHQRRTVANFLALRDALGGLVVPVVQGWEPAEYLRCVDLYERAGVALDREPRVGVGLRLPPPGHRRRRPRVPLPPPARDPRARVRRQDDRPQGLRRRARVRRLDGMELRRRLGGDAPP